MPYYGAASRSPRALVIATNQIASVYAYFVTWLLARFALLLVLIISYRHSHTVTHMCKPRRKSRAQENAAQN